MWVSGEAGWFEIHPHEKYATVYNEMCDAISLYYKVMQVYEIAGGHKSIRKRKKAWAKLGLGEVFFQVSLSFCLNNPRHC